ncbi:hypothetical protein LCGC14_1163910 [marine sediment metagenome]|uniref:Uncharacterized protein n=1 Tax=marine sediment metagenome TaxID=412755 RepID=A0A0F9LRT4_9ZZZZ
MSQTPTNKGKADCQSADSPLWTTPAAPGPGPFAHLTIPANIDEIAAQVVRDSMAKLKKRLAPYNTKVTMRTLMMELD